MEWVEVVRGVAVGNIQQISYIPQREQHSGSTQALSGTVWGSYKTILVVLLQNQSIWWEVHIANYPIMETFMAVAKPRGLHSVYTKVHMFSQQATC